ncbi:MAG TPA: hypothetical protein VK009_25890 [Chloroflexota bacterium]|nr:hypothetical protein [Chloroflexota bacterium]
MQSSLGKPGNSMMWRLGERYSMALVVSGFLILGCLYLVLALPFSKPDERYHYAYAEYVKVHHSLPVLSMDLPNSMAAPPEQHEAHQPPLFYVIAATAMALDPADRVLDPPSNPHYLSTPIGNFNPFVVPPDPQTSPPSYSGFYAGRFLSLLFSLAGVVCMYYAVRTFAPKWLASCIAALMAFKSRVLVHRDIVQQ